MHSLMARLRTWAKAMKTETHALYLATTDRRTPWCAKAIAIVTVAYALSPIDLIPDFIPVLGYVDDLLLIPLGIYIATRLIPTDVMSECRTRAADSRLSKSWKGAWIVFGVWVVAAILLFAAARRVLVR